MASPNYGPWEADQRTAAFWVPCASESDMHKEQWIEDTESICFHLGRNIWLWDKAVPYELSSSVFQLLIGNKLTSIVMFKELHGSEDQRDGENEISETQARRGVQ